MLVANIVFEHKSLFRFRVSKVVYLKTLLVFTVLFHFPMQKNYPLLLHDVMAILSDGTLFDMWSCQQPPLSFLKNSIFIS